MGHLYHSSVWSSGVGSMLTLLCSHQHQPAEGTLSIFQNSNYIPIKHDLCILFSPLWLTLSRFMGTELTFHTIVPRKSAQLGGLYRVPELYSHCHSLKSCMFFQRNRMSDNSHPLFLSSLCKPLTGFVSTICLFWTFHRKGMIHNEAF